MASAAAVEQAPVIPNRLYFRIGEVSRLTGVKPYVIRFWEGEFAMLSPKKSGANQRLYRRKDVELLLTIKHLLYEKRFTIEGARAYLHERRSHAKAAPVRVAKPARSQANLFAPNPEEWGRVREELRSVLALLE
jgi:DNA-binding transcriptional MerR regulator